MPMIEGIDGSKLIAAFRQGREDRASDDKTKAAQAEKAQWGGLVKEYYGAQETGGGVAGQYAPSQPAKAPTMADAFNPQAMGQMGAMDAGGAAPAAMTPPQAPPQAPPRAAHRSQSEIMHDMLMLNPEQADHYITGLKNMGETELAAFQKSNDAMGHVAHWIEGEVARNPQADPRQLLMSAADYLRAAGIKDEQIAAADMSPQGLRRYYILSNDLDKLHDNELADRESLMPKVVTPQQGAGAFAYNPATGRIETTIAPNDGKHPFGAPVAGPVTKTIGDKTYYQTPDGKWHDEAPGGGVSNGTSGFPPGG